MNKVQTFKQYVRITVPGKFKEFCIAAKSILDKRFTVFTGVHHNMGFGRYTDTVNIIKENLAELVNYLLTTSGIEQAFQIIKSIKNFGNFFTWRVCDLTEVNLIRCSGDWASLGLRLLKDSSLP